MYHILIRMLYILVYESYLKAKI